MTSILDAALETCETQNAIIAKAEEAMKEATERITELGSQANSLKECLYAMTKLVEEKNGQIDALRKQLEEAKAPTNPFFPVES